MRSSSLEKVSSYFNSLWEASKPLAKLFRTETKGYLYDTGTNKIVCCSEAEFELLEKLLSMEINKALSSMGDKYSPQQIAAVANKIKTSIEKESILLTKRATQFGRSSHFANNLAELLTPA